MSIGPLQLLVVGFTDPKLDGSILEALADASDAGTIRVVDLLGVYKDEAGDVVSAQVSELTEDEAATYGAWVGALIGLGAAGEEGAEIGAVAGAVSAIEEYEYGIDEDRLTAIADAVPAGGAAMLLVVEHVWAIPFRDAVRASGGIMITQDFLSPELLISMGVLAGAGAAE